MTKNNSRLRQQCSKLYNIVVGVLSLAPCYVRKKQVRAVDQTAYPLQTSVASLATDWWMEPWPPALNFNLELERERTKEEKEREEVLHLFRCYTHTHPAGAGSTLKGKRKKKADTRRANGQKQRRGGRGTDGPPEPTYTAKRTWQKQRTHLNPTTHYGEARGEN